MSEEIRDLTKEERQIIEEQVIEQIGHISSELAHDLRSPLQTIQNAIYLIQRNPSNEQLYVMVKQSLQQVTDTLDNFRDYYKGHILQRLVVDPVKVLDLAFSELAIPENIQVVKEYATVEPISLDPAKFALAVRKLLANAVDAMPDGGELRITLVKTGEVIEITVGDTGAGVPPEVAEVINTPFISGQKRGNGLGVPTAKRIVESHGGELLLHSEVDIGTTWTIRLPLSAVNL